jgi:hypothetical protein
MQKVMEINLERGLPAVEDAIKRMKSELSACKRGGVRAAVLIHGYGSSGVGGGIRAAARRALSGPDMAGIVRDAVPGEQWHYRKRELLSACRELAPWEGRIANNEGVTVVILK